MSQWQLDPEHAVVASVFTPDERAVMQFWLEHPGAPPAAESDAARVLREWGIERGGGSTPLCVASGVAQIALAAVEDRLPQKATLHEDGCVLGRRVRAANQRFERAVVLRPRFLFSLDWAATAPGVSWPRAYYATWFPGYDVWVVTASADSPELWGVLDIAVGWFDDRVAFADGVRDTVVAHWRRDEWLEPGGEWEYFWAEGLVSAAEALAWREVVWPSTVVDDDVEDEDEAVDDEDVAES
jgi:hypothetical protein